MQITFSWKNFEFEKPEVGVPIIVKGKPQQRKDRLWLGVFEGEVENCYGRKEFRFRGKQFSTSSLILEKVLVSCISNPNEYDNGFNPYNFLWDYYNWDNG